MRRPGRDLVRTFLALALALTGAAGARASGSAPVLTLAGGDAFVTSGGARAVVVTGSFNFDDRLQFGFPVGVLVVQGERVVRYDVDGTIVSATSPLVADGVDTSEVPALLALAGAAPPPAALVQIRPDRLTVALPPEMVAGAAAVMLYASRDSASFLSNVVALELP